MSLQSSLHPQYGTYLSSQSQIHDCAEPVPEFPFDATGLVNHMMESIDPVLGSLSGHTSGTASQVTVSQEQGNTNLSRSSQVDPIDEQLQQTTHQSSDGIDMGTVRAAPATIGYRSNQVPLSGPCSTQHASIAVTFSNHKKRKTAAGRIQDQDTDSSRLNNHVELEKTRCQEEGLVFRPADFDSIFTDSVFTQACASPLRYERYISTLKALFSVSAVPKPLWFCKGF